MSNAEFEDAVMAAFKPVNQALGQAMAELAAKGYESTVRFDARAGILVVLVHRGRAGGWR